ncbi:rod shape-determining protein RodA [Pelagibacteraceae bacterium]|nr:rod shape-determining protein RodA [Candidatus Pelagibacter sp.]MDC1485361.1 rod shape-determining protein RodA [Pelagibacteraceae bacterium]
MFKKNSYIDRLTFFQKIKSFDFILMFCIIILGIVSSLAMYSTDGGELLHHSKSHIIRFLIFFLMMIFLSFLNIRFWHSIGYFLYALILASLLWASLYGVTASGSQRWISLYFINLQPSELMKISIIICLAKYYHRNQIHKVNDFRNLLFPVTILILPILLVVSQPDLGTSILIALSGIVVLWLSGVNIKYFVYSFLVLVISAPFVITLLKPYQKLRILTFFDPGKDPLGAGYQVIQSKIAVGSGGLFGKGFLKGTQSYLEFLPEKHTDFIFTLFAEEHGLIGSLFLLIVYGIMIYRILRIGSLSRSFFARIFCYSFASAIFIYISVNMSMVLGLLPIVGSPLPIMSYGGSSMLATMIGFAVVMSAKIYHRQLIS